MAIGLNADLTYMHPLYYVEQELAKPQQSPSIALPTSGSFDQRMWQNIYCPRSDDGIPSLPRAEGVRIEWLGTKTQKQGPPPKNYAILLLAGDSNCRRLMKLGERVTCYPLLLPLLAATASPHVHMSIGRAVEVDRPAGGLLSWPRVLCWPWCALSSPCGHRLP